MSGDNKRSAPLWACAGWKLMMNKYVSRTRSFVTTYNMHLPEHELSCSRSYRSNRKFKDEVYSIFLLPHEEQAVDELKKELSRPDRDGSLDNIKIPCINVRFYSDEDREREMMLWSPSAGKLMEYRSKLYTLPKITCSKSSLS